MCRPGAEMASEWEALVRTFGSASAALDVLMAEGALEQTVAETRNQ